MLRSALGAVCLLALAVPASAQSYGERSALPRIDCDRTCLEGFAKAYVAALAAKDPSRAPFAKDVKFTENSVVMPIGDGLWGTVTAANPDDGMIPADLETANVAWFGHVQENGHLVFVAIRLHVDHNHQIDEAETVVSRQTGMPLIFGTGKEPHNPAWTQALTDQSRPRSRLRSIADSYFSTLEYNDGTVFAPFSDECSRLENGISTTAKTANSNNSASVAEGCENQFKLGIYKINKQLRERRFPLIDTERGIVVASDFMDHANYFDEYKLNDGRTMKTLLKWPNSLDVMEAFKIVDGKIYTIEANFDYVPYGMHSPWAEASQ